ncbi:MAG: ATP-binding cassette domain-containing protein [Lachnospiraceae bacterium]|nr:ATP-binding cassette domain-containing protein [Lachnospiraceae bacterium]
MIRAEALCKQFDRTVMSEDKKKGKASRSKKETFLAVDHVSFEVQTGEIVGLLGPNGAGKTTLLRMLGCLMQPTEGSVMITDTNGECITDPVKAKNHIGYLSGNTKLYHRLSVREMLQMLGEIYGIDREETAARIEKISSVLDMGEFLDNRIERLSTGQTQRASIARTLIHEPDIYIFDEPTLGLDILSADAIVSFMKQQKEAGKTVLYSTHYLEEAQFLCDRILMICKGRIVCEGSPESIMERFGAESLRDAFHKVMQEQNAGEESGETAMEETESREEEP